MTINISASGESYSFGAAAATGTSLAIAITAAGSSQSAGDAAVVLALPPGGLTDFGIWDLNGVDPAISCLMTSIAGTPNGRASCASTVPIQYTTALGTLWNGAQWAAVRMIWDSESPAAITAVQIESVTLGNLLPPDAADYRTRLAYTPLTDNATVSRTDELALSGTYAGKLVNVGGYVEYSMAPMDISVVPCTPGDVITASVNVAMQDAGAEVSAVLQFYYANMEPRGISGSLAIIHPGGFAWVKPTVQSPVLSGAAYVGVVPTIFRSPPIAGEVAYVDCHHIASGIPSISLAPSAYQAPRQQNITILPNRANLMFNPGFNSSTSSWWATGGPSPELTWDETVGRTKPGAAKLVASYGSGTWPQIGSQSATTQAARGMALLTPGVTYTVSGWVLAAPGMPAIGITVQIDGDVYFNGSTTVDALADDTLQDAGWLRTYLTFTVPQSTSGNTSVIFGTTQAGWSAFANAVTFWVDDVLCEQTPVLTGYFDGDEPSLDYMWAGANDASPSLYYRDFRALQYRLDELVAPALPLGVPYALNFTLPYS
jgi:hypothetical protein